VLGDSLTAGFGLPRAQAFPAQLEQALRAGGRDVRVVDAGVSSDTSAGGRARLPWVLGSKPADAPDAAIIELGGNDVLRGFAPPTTAASLDAILAELKTRGVPTLLAGMRAPPNLGAEYEREFNAIYPELAQRYDALLFPFFLEGVAGLPALNQQDGIHPNAEGVALIVKNLTPMVEQLLDRRQPARPPAR
jgi:acyl-CoA thioesterase I